VIPMTIHKIKCWLLGGATLGLAMTSPGLSRADTDSFRPMIEVGGGAHVGEISKTSVLLRLGFGVRKNIDDPLPGDITTPEQLIIAHIDGTIAVSPDGINGTKVPYMDIRFTPIRDRVSVINDNGNELTGELQFLPIAIGRNINVDQFLTINVSVIAVQFADVRPQNDYVALFAQVAADALGYKMLSHVSDLSTFHGIHLLTLGGEAGVAFTINDSFAVRASIGGSADINWWGKYFQSDMKAYAAIRASIYRFMQIFLQGGVIGNWDSRHSFFQGGLEGMVGLTLLF
jgi:hypothetical protein